MHSGVLIHPPSQSGYNGTGGELSPCVINTSIITCIILFGTLSEQIYQLTFYPFLFSVLILFFQHIYLKYAIV